MIMLGLTTSILGKLDERFAHPFFWLKNHIGAIIEHRKNNRTDRKDFVRLMLECLSDESTKHFDEADIDYTQTKHEKKMNLDVSSLVFSILFNSL